jgi:hypothetical protein
MPARAAPGSNSRSAILVVVAFAAALINGNSTAAEVSHDSAACTNSSLTVGRFADLFYSVASKGDLHDVSFIERTMNLRFEPVETINGLDVRRASSLFGAPIATVLEITDNPERNQPIATLTFEDIQHCFDLDWAAFGEDFRGWAPVPPPILSPSVSEIGGKNNELENRSMKSGLVHIMSNGSTIFVYARGTFNDRSFTTLQIEQHAARK